MKTKVRDLLEQLQRFDPDKELEFHAARIFEVRCKECNHVARETLVEDFQLDRVVELGGTVVVRL